jgi:NTP pyrophosphatase (non-canonical NTP hydrolase)
LIKTLNDWAKYIADWRKRKKFVTKWKNLPTKLMLVVTELAEAMEGYRDNNKDKVKEELGDAFIRIADIFGSLGWDFDETVENIMENNELRPLMHNRKFNDESFLEAKNGKK